MNMKKDELIKKLWKLWEDLAMTGELTVGGKFHKEYKKMEDEILKQDIPIYEKCSCGKLKNYRLIEGSCVCIPCFTSNA